LQSLNSVYLTEFKVTFTLVNALLPCSRGNIAMIARNDCNHFFNHRNDFKISLQCFSNFVAMIFGKEWGKLYETVQSFMKNNAFGRFKDLQHLLFGMQILNLTIKMPTI
jgi:hypothetical protein